MNNLLYQFIFKRKSFHLFRNVGNDKLSNKSLNDIEKAWEGFETLYPDIRTAIRIVPAEKFSFKHDAEYCVLIYSEKKENYLMNAGYIGEQLDLYLVSQNIGTLWFGIGKPDEKKYDGLDYVIMIAIHKISDESLYRKDMFRSKRKPLEEIWDGETLGVAEIVRFAPSACNSQPWVVKNEDGLLYVFRNTKEARIGIMSPKMAKYFNRIDIGIFLCILEICIEEKNIEATRELYIDSDEKGYSLVAKYYLKHNIKN